MSDRGEGERARAQATGAAAVLVLVLLPLLGAGTCSHVPDPEAGPLGRHVDPFVGTGGLPWTSGMLFPGATAPFGMVRLSPDTSGANGVRIAKAATAGYGYGDRYLLGFSHGRLSGAGVADGQQLRVTPAIAPVAPGPRPGALGFSHGDEVAAPGFYAVWLPEIETLVELTATEHAGVHRYTFPAGSSPRLVFDVTSAPAGGRADEAWVEVHPEAGEVVGSSRSFGDFSSRYGGLRGWFVAELGTPIVGHATWDEGGTDTGAEVEVAAGAPVEVRVGVSFVSLEGARANLAAEVGGRSFDDVYAGTRAAWEERLGRARVESTELDVLEIYYTSLYHSMIMPTRFTDVTGEYLGFEGTVGVADGFTYVTDLSLWDTFRTTHPLYALVQPDVQRDAVKSLIRMARIGGSLPRWPSGGGYTGSMFGSPADMLVAESYLKGITDFEVEEAYGYMKATATAPAPPGASGREQIEECLAVGWCAADEMQESVARTLEFAWADASIANLAAALGHGADAATFRQRALAYAGTWNPASGFFHPRNADGTYQDPFYPELLTYVDDALFGGRYTNDYVEGNARQWRFSVPQDPAGLIGLFGGAAPFVAELEDFMADASPSRGAAYPGSGYWHGNEPDLHAPYLFVEAGRADLTQQWVRWALTTRYGTGPDGLDGNDDGGALSAWYVLSALGLYPVAGSDLYWLGAPIVDRAELTLAGGATLVVEAVDQAVDHAYVREVRLDGVRLCEPRLRHGDLAGGGTLTFEMSATPAPGGGFGC